MAGAPFKEGQPKQHRDPTLGPRPSRPHERLAELEWRIGDDPLRLRVGAVVGQEVSDTIGALAVVEDVTDDDGREIVPQPVGQVTFATGRLPTGPATGIEAPDQLGAGSRGPGRGREIVQGIGRVIRPAGHDRCVTGRLHSLPPPVSGRRRAMTAVDRLEG